MKVVSTKEFKEKQDSYLNMAEQEEVVIKHGTKFIRLTVSETVEEEEPENIIDENRLEEYLAVPEEYRCNPFDVSPSSDLFWADRRNIEEVNKGIEDAKAGRVTTVLNKRFSGKSPEELLRRFISEYGNRIALASSLGPEDQVLTDMILKIEPSARIFTIDTGRLFPETYSLAEKTNMAYNIKMEVYFPERKPVEDYVRLNGINAFYESIDKRKACCRVRKIEPLLRALSTLDVWICGLRQEQSVTRQDIETVEWDETHQRIKINPLARWQEQDVWDYIKKHSVPYNILHKKGYPSIGCQPCTRSVAEGEDVRAGRWWWENPEHKECGLHRRR